MADIREQLRCQLIAHGYNVGSDTRAAHGEIYLKGEGDLASALFEFKPSVNEAIDTMYQGAWVEGLPPRFAVLPECAAEDPSFELLEQMGIIPLLYKTGERTEFLDLDRLLQEHLVR
ncbi:MAG: hypothetical protein M1617_04050 [Actinobacteria bacterium]|nr:hypothetical protein [Actinomycetota bacterium]MCL5887463.1 hypothetical protein [Actinomycetota bacterium]